MGLVYGIDFGTSNSAIMVGLPDGRIRRVHNPVEGIYDIPSVVCLRADDTIVVGSVAWRMRLQRPAWYRDEFKRDIGRSYPIIFPPENPGDIKGSRRFEVNYLVAQVLRLLREQAEREVPGDVDLVVITVPASWQASNRSQMLQAAAIAGFDTSRIHLVAEPEAAVAYAVQEHLGLQEQTLLVYDLGGGTFDCAIVRGSRRSGFEVLGEAGGLDDVGGVIFNRKILGLIRSRFPREMGQLFTSQTDDIQVLQRRLQIRETCEFVKRYLSTELHFEGMLPELSPNAQFILTRTELAELISPMLTETITECERLLRSLKMDWGGIDMVVPVGGSSRLPIVGETIARYSGKQHASVMRVEDPELAVVHGAALHALALANSSAHGGIARWETTLGEPVPQTSPVAPPAGPWLLPEPPPEPQPEPEPDLVSAPWSEPAMSKTQAERVPLPVDTAASPPPRRPRRDPRKRAGNFPPSGVTYHARQTEAIARVWRWHTGTVTACFLAAALAIVNFFDLPGDTKPAHGITQGELTIAAYVLTVLCVAGFVITTVVLNKALKNWGGMATAAVAIACAAAAHFYVHGWLGWVILVLSLTVALLTWGVATENIPSKTNFVRDLRINSSGLVLNFADGHDLTLHWTEIESIIEKSNTVMAVMVHDEPPGGYAYRLKFNQIRRTLELFARYDFTPERDVLAAIDFYSGRRLTQEMTPSAG